MPTTISGSSGVTFPDATTQTTAATASIPAGAITNFVNASAPTGWTQVTTYNNYAMRIVSGTGAGTGGSVGFTTAFASQTPAGTIGGTTLSTSQIPSHSHPLYQYGTTANPRTYPYNGGGPATDITNTVAIGSTGGGGSHDHTFTGTAINLAVQYVDNILCQKN